MRTLRDTKPTSFDHSPAVFDPDHADWLVGPCSKTRDSVVAERVNFAEMLAALDHVNVYHEDTDEDDYEVRRFGHWGPGWYEIVIIRPGSACHVTAERIEERLDSYPLLNECATTDEEYREAAEWWARSTVRQRAEIIAGAYPWPRLGTSIFAARRSEFPTDPQGSILDRLRS